MKAQTVGAFARAFLVAIVIALPSLILAAEGRAASPLVLAVALAAGFLVFTEYMAHSPSILEFRFAAPYNRLRFAMLVLAVLVLSIVARGWTAPGAISVLLTDIGTALRAGFDFPYSPVRLVGLLAPEGAPEANSAFIETAAALCYALSLAMLAIFAVVVRVSGWPVRSGAFNVWTNLPLFDPTGGDVVQKLNREALVNVSLGIALPFLLPALVPFLSDFVGKGSAQDPQTLIWILSAWAFLPASLVMRGIAVHRVAGLISAKRRRVYAQSRGALLAA